MRSQFKKDNQICVHNVKRYLDMRSQCKIDNQICIHIHNVKYCRYFDMHTQRKGVFRYADKTKRFINGCIQNEQYTSTFRDSYITKMKERCWVRLKNYA